jgi:hypothetical protein
LFRRVSRENADLRGLCTGVAEELDRKLAVEAAERQRKLREETERCQRQAGQR